jgi:hypothetical protein
LFDYQPSSFDPRGCPSPATQVARLGWRSPRRRRLHPMLLVAYRDVIVFWLACFPIAKRYSDSNQAVDVGFRVRCAIPNTLNVRIAATCHPIDGVVLPSHSHNDGASIFATQLALRQVRERPSSGYVDNSPRDAKDHQGSYGIRDQLHRRLPRESSDEGSLCFLANLLNRGSALESGCRLHILKTSAVCAADEHRGAMVLMRPDVIARAVAPLCFC